jgi:hypothetical protein
MPDFIVFKAGKASPPPYQGGVRGGLQDLLVHDNPILVEVLAVIFSPSSQLPPVGGSWDEGAGG